VDLGFVPTYSKLPSLCFNLWLLKWKSKHKDFNFIKNKKKGKDGHVIELCVNFNSVCICDGVMRLLL
jgi:hypothetical protein